MRECFQFHVKYSENSFQSPARDYFSTSVKLSFRKSTSYFLILAPGFSEISSEIPSEIPMRALTEMSSGIYLEIPPENPAAVSPEFFSIILNDSITNFFKDNCKNLYRNFFRRSNLYLYKFYQEISTRVPSQILQEINSVIYPRKAI